MKQGGLLDSVVLAAGATLSIVAFFGIVFLGAAAFVFVGGLFGGEPVKTAFMYIGVIFTTIFLCAILDR